MEKYGFVYIWYDRKHKRYYIGCRWGNISDGYICSSNWMRNSYNRRKKDFKRRILQTNIKDRKSVLVEEYKWLSLIKKEELGKRYYNLQNNQFGHWSTAKDKLLTVGEKISASPYRAERIRAKLIGRKVNEEQKEKIRKTLIGRKLTEEHKQNIRENHNRNYDDPVFKENMSKAAKNRSKQHRKTLSKSLSLSRTGTKLMKNENGIKKFVKPNTTEAKTLLNNGFVLVR